MARVFITGGAGFVGYHLVQELLAGGHGVVVYDNLVNYIPPHQSRYNHYLQKRLSVLRGRVELIKGDICDADHLTRAAHETKSDIVIQLAGVPLASACNQLTREAMAVNLQGTVALLEAVQKNPLVKRVIYTSSSFVYGNFRYDPADEKHPLNPIDIYGATKLAGENLIKGFGNKLGVEYVIVRPSAVYGPTDANRRVSQIFVENALEGKPLVLDNGGLSRIDFSYVKDVAKGFMLAALKPEAKNEVFNITAGEGRSLKEFAEILKTLIPNLQTAERSLDPSEVRPERGSLDISKARAVLGYEPKYRLEDGLREYVEYVKAQKFS